MIYGIYLFRNLAYICAPIRRKNEINQLTKSIKKPFTMSLKLIARIEPYGQAGYLAYIDSIKGMVEMAATPETAMKELLISLKVKLAYDLGIDIDVLKESLIAPFEYKIEKTDLTNRGFTEKEINLSTLVC